MNFEPLGKHMLVKFYNCDNEILYDCELIEEYMREAAKEINNTIVKRVFHIFNLYGITVAVIMKEAHLTIHTLPGYGYAVVELFTCRNDINPWSAFKCLKKNLKAHKSEALEAKPMMPIPPCYAFRHLNRNIESTKYEKLKGSPIISILGSSGGVAKSVLSILNKAVEDKNDPIHSLISNCQLHLIDCKQKDMTYFEKWFPNIKNKITLYEFNLKDTYRFMEHLRSTKTTHVIDISNADTVEMLKCCNELGVVYINSAFENTSVDENVDLEGFTLQERYKIYESNKKEFLNTTAIICSGMNPGVVQWMAVELINKNPHEVPKACYIVEEDTSFYEDESFVDKDTIYTTWSTECFLDEAILSYPAFMKQHMPLFMYKKVYDLEFKVSLGKKQFYGCLMPHEEAITLGQLYNMETGFIYKINDHTTNLIKDNIDNLENLWNKPMKVLDPAEAPLKGEDLVGVLVVYEDKERYMYNVLNNKEIFARYQTNATYFQVACGIYGALATVLLDDIPQGIYYVDELLVRTKSKYGKYLSYYMKEFVVGENKHSDGDLLDRMKKDN
ncbi:adenosylmethionine decarboxylase [Clostridium ganghwense]|uniref:Adenosylmethionine decarboxylase n=1 Tax=Clostridium ganghwense TaxID=312089 RepID=A0ABT4CQZ1_9CLOT|nr:adenosylmethionine decarboxylase [Clostridium ganghwense]MCY6371479.1 adenosylmethionine decarboxylase [Clostridium ganghwense]